MILGISPKNHQHMAGPSVVVSELAGLANRVIFSDPFQPELGWVRLSINYADMTELLIPITITVDM